METIQVQVSSELARRLLPYRSELPRILEWGLHRIERETETKTEAESTRGTMALQKQIVAALHRAGAIGPNPGKVAQYLAGHENRRWMPIRAGGKPASQMIIEERDSRPWAG